uniref:Uncharacterized protein n=1 Tax=Heterorhabditis bacteriophora TaxID=37862 RepID=A0A1I7XTL4_HETBA
MWNDPQSAVPMSRSLNEPAFQYPDSVIGIGDSSSSTNSSAPSTPALPLGNRIKIYLAVSIKIKQFFLKIYSFPRNYVRISIYH